MPPLPTPGKTPECTSTVRVGSARWIAWLTDRSSTSLFHDGRNMPAPTRAAAFGATGSPGWKSTASGSLCAHHMPMLG